MPALRDIFKTKPNYVTLRTSAPPSGADGAVRSGAEGSEPLWMRCESCGNLLYTKELSKNLYTCEKCNFHFRIGAWERLAQLVDANSFTEWDAELETLDPLGFPGYNDKLEKSRKSTGLREAVIAGEASIEGQQVAIAVVDFGFIGGSMGSVVGEKIARCFRRARQKRLPVVVISAGGGGARMQEGILSLMQMAKTAQAVQQHSEAGLLYVSVLTDPTMGGVYASFASLADIILAEPGALIGFAGPRVVEESTRQKLPPGFQRAEFALKNGMIDLIVDRKELRKLIVQLLKLHPGHARRGSPKIGPSSNREIVQNAGVDKASD